LDLNSSQQAGSGTGGIGNREWGKGKGEEKEDDIGRSVEDDDEKSTKALHATPQPLRRALEGQTGALAHSWVGGISLDDWRARRKEERRRRRRGRRRRRRIFFIYIFE
jgi:hypothetical protein